MSICVGLTEQKAEAPALPAAQLCGLWCVK